MKDKQIHHKRQCEEDYQKVFRESYKGAEDRHITQINQWRAVLARGNNSSEGKRASGCLLGKTGSRWKMVIWGDKYRDVEKIWGTKNKTAILRTERAQNSWWCICILMQQRRKGQGQDNRGIECQNREFQLYLEASMEQQRPLKHSLNFRKPALFINE